MAVDTAAEVQTISAIAQGIRRRVLAHTLSNNGGYMSQACSAAELLGSLYGGVLNLAPLPEPYNPPPFPGVPSVGGGEPLSGAVVHGEPGPDRDRLIASPAHYALVIYAALIESGRLREDALDQFNVDGSTVEMIGAEHSPGFETTTGSLAQALSQAGGIALGRRLKGETGNTWVFMSDGEFQEGQTWEALAAISWYGLSTVRIIVDVNGAQCDGPMDRVMNVEPLAHKLTAFGWDVHRVDGHDVNAILSASRADGQGPRAILCDTDPVRGLPLMQERFPVLHYLRFKSEDERAQYEKAYEGMLS